MQHIYKEGTNSSKPVLLHGTGGNEIHLLPLAEIVDSTASVLSVRGNVLEQGMPRFFKRIAEGVFDIEDLELLEAAGASVEIHWEIVDIS